MLFQTFHCQFLGSGQVVEGGAGKCVHVHLGPLIDENWVAAGREREFAFQVLNLTHKDDLNDVKEGG
jgi:hypothetical protein